MTGPGQEADAVALVKGVQDNADRLGLTWQMRIATVVDVSDPASPSIVFDGDDTNTPGPSISMVGNPGVNSRVYVLDTPGPAGTSGAQYITGFATPAGTRLWSAKTVLTATQAAITMTIPRGVTQLQLDWTARDTTGAGSGAAMRMTINGDTANNYVYRSWQVAGATASAGVHNQTFAISAALIGVYATGGATAGRFGNGWVRFPAWNNPHGSNLGWTYMSDMENAPNDGWLASGGGFYGAVGPYSTVTLQPQVGSTWAVGTQVIASGLIL